ncbi:uncharacterized protein ACNS7B_004658 isoform 2-T2 [Menidia menidia]
MAACSTKMTPPPGVRTIQRPGGALKWRCCPPRPYRHPRTPTPGGGADAHGASAALLSYRGCGCQEAVKDGDRTRTWPWSCLTDPVLTQNRDRWVVAVHIR